jgi:ADP-ribose pyrophosphatase YjhB (NUDIX family)
MQRQAAFCHVGRCSTFPFSNSAGIDPERLTRQPLVMPEFVRRIPEGDNRERMICADCGHIAYENPKVVVGSVVTVEDTVLLCRRAIEPRLGFWTLPAGYLELGETLEEGAAREAWEEAHADIVLDGILGVFTISRIGQVQVIFRARFADAGRPRFAAGAESLEVALFPWQRIPWADIAFPSVNWALHAWQRTGADPLGQPTGNPASDLRGTERIAPANRGGVR